MRSYDIVMTLKRSERNKMANSKNRDLTLTVTSTGDKYTITTERGIGAMIRLADCERVISPKIAAKKMGQMVADNAVWTLHNNNTGKKIGAAYRDGKNVDWYQSSFISNLSISSAVINQLRS